MMCISTLRLVNFKGYLVNELCTMFMQIWNVSDGQLLHSCAPISVEEGTATHGGWVTDVCFSPDSKTLVSAGGYLKVSVTRGCERKSSRCHS